MNIFCFPLDTLVTTLGQSFLNYLELLYSHVFCIDLQVSKLMLCSKHFCLNPASFQVDGFQATVGSRNYYETTWDVCYKFVNSTENLSLGITWPTGDFLNAVPSKISDPPQKKIIGSGYFDRILLS